MATAIPGTSNSRRVRSTISSRFGWAAATPVTAAAITTKLAIAQKAVIHLPLREPALARHLLDRVHARRPRAYQRVDSLVHGSSVDGGSRSLPDQDREFAFDRI